MKRFSFGSEKVTYFFMLGLFKYTINKQVAYKFENCNNNQE